MPIKVSIANFFIIGVMAVLFILLFKSLMAIYPIDGLDKFAFAI